MLETSNFCKNNTLQNDSSNPTNKYHGWIMFLGMVQRWLTMVKQYGQPWLTMVKYSLPYGWTITKNYG